MKLEQLTEALSKLRGDPLESGPMKGFQGIRLMFETGGFETAPILSKHTIFPGITFIDIYYVGIDYDDEKVYIVEKDLYIDYTLLDTIRERFIEEQPRTLLKQRELVRNIVS